jgi:hypothetical protein
MSEVNQSYNSQSLTILNNLNGFVSESVASPLNNNLSNTLGLEN